MLVVSASAYASIMTYRLKEWQLRGQTAINNVINLADFQDDIARLKSILASDIYIIDDGDEVTNIFVLIEKYKLPLGTYKCLENYIITGHLEPQLIETSLFIVSAKEHRRVPTNNAIDNGIEWQATKMLVSSNRYLQLFIPEDATQKEILDFLTRYRTQIEELQEAHGGTPRKRLRSKSMAARNSYALELSKLGIPNSEIADRLNEEFPEAKIAHTAADVRKIISRLKKQIDTERDT